MGESESDDGWESFSPSPEKRILRREERLKNTRPLSRSPQRPPARLKRRGRQVPPRIIDDGEWEIVSESPPRSGVGRRRTGSVGSLESERSRGSKKKTKRTRCDSIKK